MSTLDAFDRRLLAALQENGAYTNAELAERVNLSPSQCSRRLQGLRESGLVKGVFGHLDRHRLGLDCKAFVLVTLDRHSRDHTRRFTDLVGELPDILECAMITGDGDYMLRVVTRDLASFHALVRRLLDCDALATVRSSLVLEEIKDTHELPVP